MARKSKTRNQQKKQQKRAANSRRRQAKRREQQARSDGLSDLAGSALGRMLGLDGLGLGGAHLPQVGLEPPHPERLGPPIHLDRNGSVVPDPHQTLGLSHGEADAEAIRRGWREQLVAHPPEREPDAALRIREARDRLLEPERVLERELGVVRAPDPVAWGLSDEPREKSEGRLDAEGRLAGQAVLYALVEDALWSEGLSDWWKAWRARPRRGRRR